MPGDGLDHAAESQDPSLGERESPIVLSWLTVPYRGMAERRVWVLDTETKGTGAEMVPLDTVERHPEPARAAKVWVPPKRRPREPEEPKPRAPRRFRVIDVLTREVLADGAGLRATLDVLAGVRRRLDVNVFVWEPEDERWRLLSVAEQDAVWRRRPAKPAA